MITSISVHVDEDTKFTPQRVEPADGSAPFSYLSISDDDAKDDTAIFTETEDVETIDRMIAALVQIRIWREDATKRLAV